MLMPASVPRATAKRPLVSLRGIDKRYANGTHALQGLDLDIAPGEFVSLLGPSGCGKSTALRIIAGLGDASSGSIDWPTSRHDAMGRPEREIGFVFQDPNLLPWATVAQNVYLPWRLKDKAFEAVRADVDAALKLVGLDRFAGAYPRELSGGMKMRVSIARALVTRPKLVLMDEPFAALDEITRHRLADDLLDIRAQAGCTIVFVTHSVYESVYLSSRIVVLAARPGRFIGELAIEEPYPRRGFRKQPAYGVHCNEVSALLERAMGEGA